MFNDIEIGMLILGKIWLRAQSNKVDIHCFYWKFIIIIVSNRCHGVSHFIVISEYENSMLLTNENVTKS